MDELKEQFEFKKLIHNMKKPMRKDTSYIPTVDQLDDTCKGKWVEHDENEFQNIFNGLLDYTMDDDEIDNVDWNSVNYEIYDAQYYSEKFPGFDDKIYELLAESTKEENKFIDERIPPLAVKHGDVTVQFK